ncbi:di-heme oxidoreductase family protein [Thiomicrorhabdus heinhorstiae]|uniref:C-type cytochrome n=1 Tax=Thiomicrorhabdus heinhorstiae TaxID=2748010 RepID=A0ABS0BZG0_9GAMM|nr:di-heme oxidoredictase family protein [Thiomicrorhabdus heinhorstiae]MBF6057376.1 c-type cytochrome [Thiomicrorhabdus heinhorstiae]
MHSGEVSNAPPVEEIGKGGLSRVLIISLFGLGVALLALLVQAYRSYVVPFEGYGEASMNYLEKEDPRSLSGGDLTHFHSGKLAYEQEAPNLSWGLSAAFDRGDGVFERTVTPSVPSNWRYDADGLGPHFNNVSCEACHVSDGRAMPPKNRFEPLSGMFFRISVPGKGLHGQPMAPHPGIGYQIADRGIEGVPAEADTRISWLEMPGSFADGESFSLRKPIFHILTSANVDIRSDSIIEARIANPVFGLGLLEAIPEETILNWADESDADGDGISGKPNYVWNPEKGENELGRFGWKANNSTLRMQTADAAFNDIGLTNLMFRELTSEYHPDFLAYQNCRPEQKECLQAYDSGKLEMSEAQMNDVTTYLQFLGVPYRRDVTNPLALKGEAVFHQIGCANCHKTEVKTAGHKWSRLNNQTIHPYTDLLLHDMGEGLSGRPDFRAEKREWRTAPLWGIGLTKTVNGHDYFLHDGRARGLQEAILWHGGEAEAAKQRYMQLEKANREALLVFLNSL